MGELVKPRGLSPLEEWAWENGSEGARRRMARAAKMINAAKEAASKERRWAPVYVRFGGLPPAGGPSSKTLTKNCGLERGVSVFRGAWEAGDLIVDVENIAQYVMYLMLRRERRPVYLAAGCEVGAGSDGEPLLQEGSVVLEEVPAGTLVRCSPGHRYQETLQNISTLVRVLSLGRVGGLEWCRQTPLEMRVRAADYSPTAPAARFCGDLATAEGRRAFVEAVLARSSTKGSPLHGPEHWKRVAVAGARLSEETPGADPLVVFLFAVVHDSQRLWDSYDAWHGWRAGRLARELLGGGSLVTAAQLDLLVFACERHDEGEVSANPTVGVCWDADRLNLWRVGKTPKTSLLSTRAARAPERIEWARGLEGAPFEWASLYTGFGRGAASSSGGSPFGPYANGVLEEQVRGHLKRWGMLEDYERVFGPGGFTGGGGG